MTEGVRTWTPEAIAAYKAAALAEHPGCVPRELTPDGAADVAGSPSSGRFVQVGDDRIDVCQEGPDRVTVLRRATARTPASPARG